jgi:DNA-binding transcriptional MerR regulator
MPDDIPQLPFNAPRLLPLVVVAELCSLSPHTIRALVKRGKLRPTRVCRRLLFDVREVERFIAECQ